MQEICDVLKKYIDDPSVFFVFPTDIAAECWADYALQFKKAVALERFTAWDRFKGEAVRAEHQDKNSIPSSLRKLFVLQLLDQNAKELFFSSLVPKEYASNPSVFADWLTSVLPCLALWKKKRAEFLAVNDDEDTDLHILEKSYRRFLDTNKLFEPAWEMPPLKDTACRYVIVYPEILQDFEEYRPLLEKTPFVEFVPVPHVFISDDVCNFFFYPDSRAELRNTALFVRDLCPCKTADGQKGCQTFDWSDIAISVPDLENLAPYILREFSLYNIPVELRSGKKLSLYPAGRLFTLIKNCAAEVFSFDSLRALLLENVFPWKDKTAVNQLIEFGIKNNCRCSYDGIDVWEEAFSKSRGEERALSLYRKLKRSITSMRSASNFQKLRDQYFVFCSAFFNVQDFSDEVNLIIGRCISELSVLIDIECTYPEAALCSDPFDFFVRVLDSKEYLAQSNGCAVNVFSYRLAAAAPFKQHIVLNASQASLSFTHRPLPFLRQEKRSLLGLHDSDISACFARLYASHSFKPMRASCSQKAFSGYTIAHNIFSSCKNLAETERYDTDSLTLEKDFFCAKGSFPPFLHSVQKQGFNAWSAALSRAFSAGQSFQDLFPVELKKRINAFAQDSQSSKIRVSPSSLNVFYTCPRQWLFSRVLTVAEYESDASVVDDLSAGTLCHEIIRRVLSVLQNEKKPISTENGLLPQELQEYIRFFTREVIEHLPESCSLKKNISPLTVENFKMQQTSLVEILISFFREFFLWFSSYTVLSLEENLSADCGDWILEGTLDCVLQKADTDDIYIVDFKTNKLPSTAECIKKPQTELKNYQLAAYMWLYEKLKCNSRPWVSGAGFFSVYQKKPSTVVGSLSFALDEKKRNPHQKNKIIERTFVSPEGFSPVNETFILLEKAAELYAKTIGDPDLSLFTDPGLFALFPDGTKISYKTCVACRHKALCRTVYSLGRKK